MFKTIWNENKKSFFKYWLVILITMIVAYVVTYVGLKAFHVDLKKAVDVLSEATNADSISSKNSSYWQDSLFLFKHNWEVCAKILIIALIPIPFLYSLSVLLTGASIGIALALIQQTGFNVFKAFFLGILPHSVLELSVFIVCAIFAGKLNKLILGNIANIFRKNKKELPSFWTQVKEMVLVFLIIVTPGIFIAGLIEGFISQYLLNM